MEVLKPEKDKKSAESTAAKSLSFREVPTSVNINDDDPSTSKPPYGISSQETGELAFSHLNVEDLIESSNT